MQVATVEAATAVEGGASADAAATATGFCLEADVTVEQPDPALE
jgi:hypothetical protein